MSERIPETGQNNYEKKVIHYKEETILVVQEKRILNNES